MQADARCRSCRAPIRWAITIDKRKRMPLDPMPVADGNIWIIEWEGRTPIIGVGLSRGAIPPSVPFAYQSHFVSCPNADDWRKT